MAKIGLRDPYYAIVTLGTDSSGEETESIGTAKRLAKAVQLQTNINAPVVKLYADDGVAESVTEFVDGSGTLTVDDLDDTALLDLYDMQQVSSSDADLLGKAETADGNYVRLGYVIRRIKGGTVYYRGIILARVQFVIPSEQWDTKGETIVLNTTQMSFNLYRDIKHVWRKLSQWKTSYADVYNWIRNGVAQSDLTAATAYTAPQ